ncbi:hypothetical protein PG988_013573 [Apiospora saccharicola]
MSDDLERLIAAGGSEKDDTLAGNPVNGSENDADAPRRESMPAGIQQQQQQATSHTQEAQDNAQQLHDRLQHAHNLFLQSQILFRQAQMEQRGLIKSLQAETSHEARVVKEQLMQNIMQQMQSRMDETQSSKDQMQLLMSQTLQSMPSTDPGTFSAAAPSGSNNNNNGTVDAPETETGAPITAPGDPKIPEGPCEEEWPTKVKIDRFVPLKNYANTNMADVSFFDYTGVPEGDERTWEKNIRLTDERVRAPH